MQFLLVNKTHDFFVALPRVKGTNDFILINFVLIFVASSLLNQLI